MYGALTRCVFAISIFLTVAPGKTALPRGYTTLAKPRFQGAGQPTEYDLPSTGSVAAVATSDSSIVAYMDDGSAWLLRLPGQSERGVFRRMGGLDKLLHDVGRQGRPTAGTLVVSPDGSRIAWIDDAFNVHVATTDGHTHRQVAFSGYANSIAWAPGSKAVCWLEQLGPTYPVRRFVEYSTVWSRTAAKSLTDSDRLGRNYFDVGRVTLMGLRILESNIAICVDAAETGRIDEVGSVTVDRIATDAQAVRVRHNTVRPPDVGHGALHSVAFSPDARWIAWLTLDARQIRLWTSRENGNDTTLIATYDAAAMSSDRLCLTWGPGKSLLTLAVYGKAITIRVPTAVHQVAGAEHG